MFLKPLLHGKIEFKSDFSLHGFINNVVSVAHFTGLLRYDSPLLLEDE